MSENRSFSQHNKLQKKETKGIEAREKEAL